MSHSSGSEFKQWVLSGIAIILTIIVSVIVVMSLPVGSGHEAPGFTAPGGRRASSGEQASANVALQAVYRAGEMTIERRPVVASFSLRPDESIDPMLPAGAFEMTMQAFVKPVRDERSAAYGLRFSGGSAAIRVGDRVLVRGSAGAEAIEIWSDALPLVGSGMRVEYTFTRDANQSATFRPLWKPENTRAAHPLPVSDAAWNVRDRVTNGLVLAQLHQCASCHEPSTPTMRTLLNASPAPMLGEAGSRLEPEWIRRWIANPLAMHEHSMMPDVFAGAPDADTVEDLTHFLVSLGGPMLSERSGRGPNADMIATGMVKFHEIGCVACHGALEPLERLPGARTGSLEPRGTYHQLDHIAGKMPHAALAGYLKDPLKTHPSGVMPSLNLSNLEADAIAAYLQHKYPAAESEMPKQSFTLDTARVDRGRQAFVEMRCSSCHELGGNRPRLDMVRSSMPFESLGAASTEGCMASISAPRQPGEVRYNLDVRERAAVRAFLEESIHWHAPDAPMVHATSTLMRLDCLACHSFAGAGGAERAIAPYFETLNDADLGDEGRLPPTLHDVGAKLNTAWMRAVLEEGGVARPYMATRMPQFGSANVERIIDTLRAASGVSTVQDDGPTMPEEFASIGRHLIGVGGFNCIQCHAIAGRAGVNVPGPDLAKAAERLRHEYFERWLNDPSAIHPGTRMPSYFIAGMSPSPQLGGDPERQVNAMWAYVSQGEALPMPDGLPDPGGFLLSVDKDPMVFRTFMTNVGVRAIAVGFPEQIHTAFDGDKARLVMIWEGEFLNAQGAWGGRGGTVTNPVPRPVWTAPAGPTFLLSDEAPATWPTTVDNQAVHFVGYELDAQRRPKFIYEVRAGEQVVEVTEQPIPKRSADGNRMLRRFTLKGPAGGVLWFNGKGSVVTDSDVEVGGIVGQRDDGVLLVPLNEHGHAFFEVTISW